MTAAFARGKKAIAECDRCGFRYKLKELKELTIKTPYNISDDHPGNLESIEYRRLGRAGQKRPFFKCFMNEPKGGGRLRSDDRMNKRFKGFSFIISYDYRSNYDPEPST